jgi:benzoyl-CoA 2,3-dioxygenase component B
MFVGETGISRVIQRTCEVMRDFKTDDVRKHGAIDLPTLQKYLNFHFSVSVDLFGSEISTNAANYYTMGIKGRFDETRIGDDHKLTDASYKVLEAHGDGFRDVEASALTALNERLRDDYVADCARGVMRWNQIIKRHGIDFELKIPHRAFHRQIGQFAELKVSPEGKVVSQAEWDAKHHDWLPTEDDRLFVISLMKPVTEIGKYAGWIAPPARGINNQPTDFEYVRP